jgi:hypothetical protein
MADYPHILVNDGRGGQMAFPSFMSQSNLDTLAKEFEALIARFFLSSRSLIPVR